MVMASLKPEVAGPTEAEDSDAIVRAASSEARRRRILEETRRLSRLRPPSRDPVFARLITVKRRAAALHVAHANRLKEEIPILSRAEAAKHRKAIRRLEAKAKKLFEKAEELRVAEVEQDRIYGDARDAILLAKVRGEDVVAFEAETADFARDEHGAKIRHKRGTKKGLPVLLYNVGLRAKKLIGIDHAFASGYLDAGRGPAHPERLKEIGEKYGEAYEIVEGAKTNRGDGVGGGFGPKGPQVKLLEAGIDLAVMRGALVKREREVLDLVCGRHHRCTEAATILKSDVRTVAAALRSGLFLAGENLKAETRRRAERLASAPR